jgi:hypothetical protein
VAGAGGVSAAATGGGEKRGTTGRVPVGDMGTAGAGADALTATGAADAEGAGSMGARTGAGTGGAGVALGGTGEVGVCGLAAATGGLADGNPIIVRAIGGRAAAGAGADTDGCGVVPVR